MKSTASDKTIAAQNCAASWVSENRIPTCAQSAIAAAILRAMSQQEDHVIDPSLVETIAREAIGQFMGTLAPDSFDRTALECHIADWKSGIPTKTAARLAKGTV